MKIIVWVKTITKSLIWQIYKFNEGIGYRQSNSDHTFKRKFTWSCLQDVVYRVKEANECIDYENHCMG